MINKEENENIIILDFEFNSLPQCTNYFYSEYGKFLLVQKKIEDKKMVKPTKRFLKKQFKNALNCVKKYIPEFTGLETCTDFYYEEYGKLASNTKKLGDKKLVKFIKDYLTENFKISRNLIKKKNKEIIKNLHTNNDKKQKALTPANDYKQLNMPLE